MVDVASSSCSALTPNVLYDIIIININHRGAEVKFYFALPLYNELKSRRLQVFLERPELEVGHILLSQIESAIRFAYVNVTIFSANYAKLKWWLDELVLMLNSGPRATILLVL